MPLQSPHVRFRENSGKHLLAASIHLFDPKRTLDPSAILTSAIVQELF
jgi:hypothetical protein